MRRNYHGSHPAAIDAIHSGNIDWTLGGGELGMGFYTTPDHWVAAKASWNCDSIEHVAVVELTVQDSDYVRLHQEALNLEYALLARERIKQLPGNGPRSFVFPFFDIIESPIAGNAKYNRNLQHKWQSKACETLLNSSSVARVIK